ncbi:MAG TPA: acylphosphatase [Candidatus Levybacteria bacterium]|nr:acylphosphatase [Candidatus Levybacteria bacterium]
MKQLHIWVSGFVQGVGYRAFTRHEARRRKLYGWVKNLPDGRVEAVMQGPEYKLREMIQACEKGSYFAQVGNIVVEWEDPAEDFSEFTIIR